MTLIMRLAKLQFQYMRLQMDRLDLYPGQPQLLLALKAHEHVSQRELARVLEITPATLTVMLRRMDGKGARKGSGNRKDVYKRQRLRSASACCMAARFCLSSSMTSSTSGSFAS